MKHSFKEVTRQTRLVFVYLAQRTLLDIYFYIKNSFPGACAEYRGRAMTVAFTSKEANLQFISLWSLF